MTLIRVRIELNGVIIYQIDFPDAPFQLDMATIFREHGLSPWDRALMRVARVEG